MNYNFLKQICCMIILLLSFYFTQAKKPLIEKQRRRRINESLNELKVLVLQALSKDVSLESEFIP